MESHSQLMPDIKLLKQMYLKICTPNNFNILNQSLKFNAY